MKQFGKTIVYVLGQAFAVNVVLPAWYALYKITGGEK